MSELTEEKRQELWAEYQNEMAGGFGFGNPNQWRFNRGFAAFLAHRRIASDFNTALGKVVRCCADHPGSDIKHTWDQTHAVLNGLPAGDGVKGNHRYFCATCGKELEKP